MHHRQPKLAGNHMHPQRLGHIAAVLLVRFVPGIFNNPELLWIDDKAERSRLFDLISPVKTPQHRFKDNRVFGSECLNVAVQITA